MGGKGKSKKGVFVLLASGVGLMSLVTLGVFGKEHGILFGISVLGAFLDLASH
jgi:hypothetical protein